MTSQLIINEPPLQVLPTLAQELGLKEAIVLQQIHYWLKLPFSRHLIDSHYWVRYTPEQWERQFAFWDQKTLRRAIKKLERLEILHFLVTKGLGGSKYYAINYRILNKVASPSQSKLKGSSRCPAYGHANLDAINIVDSEENGQ